MIGQIMVIILEKPAELSSKYLLLIAIAISEDARAAKSMYLRTGT
jgi:hypothetical protein